jgi:hypothetical protein
MTEALLFTLAVFFVLLLMIVYSVGLFRGAAIRMRDQREFLAGRTWLWVDGHFYPVEPTAEQMEEVRLYEDARRSIPMSMILNDANVEVGE